ESEYPHTRNGGVDTLEPELLVDVVVDLGEPPGENLVPPGLGFHQQGGREDPVVGYHAAAAAVVERCPQAIGAPGGSGHVGTGADVIDGIAVAPVEAIFRGQVVVDAYVPAVDVLGRGRIEQEIPCDPRPIRLRV